MRFVLDLALDDVPTARNDAASQGSENAAVTVNVFANDTAGADSVALNGGVAAVAGQGGLVTYGTPTIGASIVFDPTAASGGSATSGEGVLYVGGTTTLTGFYRQDFAGNDYQGFGVTHDLGSGLAIAAGYAKKDTGKANVNIGGMPVSPDDAGEHAVIVLTVDQSVPSDVLDRITKEIGAHTGRAVDLAF